MRRPLQISDAFAAQQSSRDHERRNEHVMTATTEHARLAASEPRIRRTDYVRLKRRLDAAQLERTIAALHETLPESSASEAAETLRRMYARAQRWEH
jgi:hypothetical protein